MRIEAKQTADSSGEVCPDPHVLHDYGVGKLALAEIETVATHVEQCDTCVAALLDLAPSDDPLLNVIQSPPSQATQPPDEHLARIRHAARHLILEQAGSIATRSPVEATSAPPRKLPFQLGSYEVEALLGRGGMGTVYKARHTTLQRDVAIKMVSPARHFDHTAEERFRREIRAIGRLDHLNIVRPTDAGEFEGCLYLVMDFVEGVDLSKLLKSRRRLPMAAACELIRQTALGLQYIHERGLVHRDIKPSNLMFTRRGQVQILDLGLATFLQTNEEDASLTGSDHILGTADYVSPEQVLDPRSVDIRSDIYGLGCTLYKLLAGRAPFEAPNRTANAKCVAHCKEEPPSILAFRGDVPDGLQQVLDRMLNKRPDDRYATPADVAEALQPWCDTPPALDLWDSLEAEAASTVDLGLTQAEISTGRRADFTVGRRSLPRRRIGIAAAVVLLVLLGGIAVWGFVGDNFAGVTSNGSSKSKPSRRHDAPDQVPINIVGDRPTYFEDLRPEQVEPGVSYRLLNREPKRLLWTEDGRSNYLFQADRQSLTVHCTDLGVLALGRTTGNHYVLQIDLFQTNWNGNLAIFFGAKPLPEAGEGCWKMQLIDIAPSLEPDRETFPYFVRRGDVEITRMKRGGFRYCPTMRRADKVSFERVRPQMLELTVGDFGLQKVRLGGKDLKEVCHQEVNRLFTPDDYAGYFGTANCYSDSDYRNAYVTITQRQSAEN